MRWNSKTGEIERLKIKTTTQEKLNLLIQYKDKYQYIESVESLVPVIIKSVVNDNEVQLAYKVTSESYTNDRPRRIDQLILLNNYSDRNVSVYQDGTTIYFCSTGSRVELTGQAAEDWLESNMGILFGVSTNTFSPRFGEEKRVLDEIMTTIRPAVIIFTGHSLGATLSNELFFYTFQKYQTQPFSIGFNGGSVLRWDWIYEKVNVDFLKKRILQFHVNYDPLSATQFFGPGTIVNLPAHYIEDFSGSHSLKNFSDFDWAQYNNFVEEGLKAVNPTTAGVVPEPIVAQPTEEPDPFLNADKDLKLMNYFDKLWELNTENYTETETWRLMEAYYNRNSDYFTPLDRFGVKEKLAYKYIYNANHPTIRPTKAQKYLFFMKIFDGFSGDNSDDYNRRKALEEQKTPEAPVAPSGGYVDYESGTNVEDAGVIFDSSNDNYEYDNKPEDQKPLFKQDKPGTIYANSFM